MNITGIAVRPGPPGSPSLTIVGETANGEGVYVVVPLTPTIASLMTSRVASGVEILARDLDNGLKSMAWIYSDPDEAVADGKITPAAGESIKAMKARLTEV